LRKGHAASFSLDTALKPTAAPHVNLFIVPTH